MQPASRLAVPFHPSLASDLPFGERRLDKIQGQFDIRDDEIRMFKSGLWLVAPFSVDEHLSHV